MLVLLLFCLLFFVCLSFFLGRFQRVKFENGRRLRGVIECNVFLKATPAPVPKRKKSLPGAADAPATILSREEASVLSSQRREEVRRQAEEAERYRANPLLYFCSPQVKVFNAQRNQSIASFNSKSGAQ